MQRSVKDELRENLLDALREGRSAWPGILGFDKTVLPQFERAILAGHDVVLLGERGQGKTRLLRTLNLLLDEWSPVIAGSELGEHPYEPIIPASIRKAEELKDDLPITWRHRSERYAEKLATPDTSVADLVGDVDPVKVAEGRSLGDPETIHFGLVPRSHRGIVAINELPDLAERIQVSLLNVMEERDIQVRGYTLRLPLDVVLVASANPEDYTNRGRIITPLKDRFGSQIRTHYPLDVEVEMDIVEQEAKIPTVADLTVSIPDFMARVVSTISQEARSSPHLNQRSGVSVRLSITNLEAVVANAIRRALRSEETVAVPRVSDLAAVAASMSGKVEVESLDEDRDAEILQRIVASAVLSVFREQVPGGTHRAIVEAFDEHEGVSTGEDMGSAAYAVLVADEIPALQPAIDALLADEDDTGPAVVASAVELILEGLHLSKRLNKHAAGPRARYQART